MKSFTTEEEAQILRVHENAEDVGNLFYYFFFLFHTIVNTYLFAFYFFLIN